LFDPVALLHRGLKSSRFNPNLETSPAKSGNRDEFNSFYSKISGTEIDFLDDIVKNRKSSKCKCNKKYTMVDLVDRESGDHVFICSNCKGTIISRKLKG